MDFRDNWLVHLRAAYALELHKNNGDAVKARAALADVVGKGPDYVYQIIGQKSKKDYPTWKMMVPFEAAYGPGRPVGWSGMSPDGIVQVHPPSIAQAFDALTAALSRFDKDDRKVLLEAIESFCKSPKTRAPARTYVVDSLSSALESGEPPKLLAPQDPMRVNEK